MSLSVKIPDSREKLEQSISALEWQLQHDEDNMSIEIHRQTLDIFRAALCEMKPIHEDGFTASKTIFCGEPGYVVSQWRSGEEVVTQFIPGTDYKAFCDAIGVVPAIVD